MVSLPSYFLAPSVIQSAYNSAKYNAMKEIKDSPCRIVYGCSVILHDKVIASASNYSMACSDECHRKKNGIPHGTRYEECFSVHAEQAALIDAHNTIGADMVLYGYDVVKGEEINAIPCKICSKMILHAEISQIYNLEGIHGAAALCKEIISR